MCIPFTNNDPHESALVCECGSRQMETINDESPHGMSALNEGYVCQCVECRRMVKGEEITTEMAGV